jgi:hypothetical protein
MQIKSYKNSYQHDVVDCPYCSYFAYVRDVTKASPDPLRDLKRHITNQAKNEAFNKLLLGESVATPHFDYYRDHTKPQKVVLTKIEKRTYDEDLTLVK